MQKFIISPDKHIGFEKKHGKLVPLHDEKAIEAHLKFTQYFKPDIYIEGGDNLDCGPVSHWLKHKKAAISDLDLTKDCQIYTDQILKPLNQMLPKGCKKYWHKGNHEEWLNDAVEENPGLKSTLAIGNLLNLKGWNIMEQGESTKIGHLHFVHGDTLPNCKNIASAAVERYNCSICFGHFHTHQTFVKHTMLNSAQPMMATAIPALCNRNPNYAENRPNQWVKGFAFGYVQPNGDYSLYVPIIINNQFMAEGKLWKG